jgi:hypothetical protein
MQKFGEINIKRNEDGISSCFYYWSLNEASFNSEYDIVVLPEMNIPQKDGRQVKLQKM